MIHLNGAQGPRPSHQPSLSRAPPSGQAVVQHAPSPSPFGVRASSEDKQSRGVRRCTSYTDVNHLKVRWLHSFSRKLATPQHHFHVHVHPPLNCLAALPLPGCVPHRSSQNSSCSPSPSSKLSNPPSLSYEPQTISLQPTLFSQLSSHHSLSSAILAATLALF